MYDYPKISIVMPSYNQGSFIEESILSVVNQNYPNLEFFVIDGGSTDNTVEIIKKYNNKITYWISEKDRGQTHAINQGFKKATGDIITWLCSDDTYLAGTLKVIGEYFIEHPNISFVFSNIKAIDRNGNIIREVKNLGFNKLSFLARVNTIPQPGTFYRRQILQDVGYLDESLHYGMDYDFFSRIILAGHRIHFLPKTLATYRYHEFSKTVQRDNTNNNFEKIMSTLQRLYAKKMGYSFITIKIAKILFKIIKIIYNLDQYWKYRKKYFRMWLAL